MKITKGQLREVIKEEIKIQDSKKAIKDIFKSKGGKVSDKFLKDIWKTDSTIRNVYDKKLFDSAWDDLKASGKIEQDGSNWVWK